MQTFRVWSEYSTNAGVWREFSIPESYGLKAHSRDGFEVPTPATWMCRIGLKSPDGPVQYLEPSTQRYNTQRAVFHCPQLK